MAMVVPTATAQKINEQSTLAKLSKSDAEVVDAKKSAKASVWVNRAKVYTDALIEPTKALNVDFDVTFLNQIMNDTPTETVTDEQQRTVLVYPWVKVYVKNNKIAAWSQTREVKEGMFDVIVEAATKALELDPKSASKVKPIVDIALSAWARISSFSRVDGPCVRCYTFLVSLHTKNIEKKPIF